MLDCQTPSNDIPPPELSAAAELLAQWRMTFAQLGADYDNLVGTATELREALIRAEVRERRHDAEEARTRALHAEACHARDAAQARADTLAAQAVALRAALAARETRLRRQTALLTAARRGGARQMTRPGTVRSKGIVRRPVRHALRHLLATWRGAAASVVRPRPA